MENNLKASETGSGETTPGPADALPRFGYTAATGPHDANKRTAR
jgi:hypothetical protein